MAYKINIRNQANNAWINLLEAQYIEVADSAGVFTGTTVETVLKELFDNKAARVQATADPGASDDGYATGTLWVNTTNDTVHICVDDTASNAIWINVSAIDTEGIEDVVGGMFPGTNTNITSSYNDTNGTIDLTVATATASVLGVASFPATDFDVSSGSVTIAAGAISVTELASNIDATAIGFDAAYVNSTSVNDSGSSTSDLWTASKIQSYVDSIASGLDWQDSVLDKDLNLPPGSPSTGDRYIVSWPAEAASGDWAGHDNEIAEWNGSTWDFTPVSEGMATWIEDEDVQFVWTGSVWAKIGTTITHANLLGLQGGTGQFGSELYHLTAAEHTAITGSKAANTVFAAPDGAGGVGGFRSLVSDDIPSLLSSKISDFTEAAQDAVGAAITAGTFTNFSLAYNDTTNTINGSIAPATTTTLGVASFNSSQFTVTGGAVSINGSSLDHGNLTGLADDDHTQYVHISTDRTITAQHTFAGGAAAEAPFVLGANTQGALVTGLNADLLNGQDWTVAATASAPSSPATNDVWIEITA